MNYGTAIWKGGTISEDLWNLSLGGDGKLTLASPPSGATELALELKTSPFLDAYVTPTWMCTIGAADRQIALGLAEGPRLQVIAELDRFDYGGRYDPGTHVVRFYSRPNHDQCVLIWEIGVALVDPLIGIVWKHIHDDTNQRVVEINGKGIELMGVDMAISVSLADGTARKRPVGHQSWPAP